MELSPASVTRAVVLRRRQRRRCGCSTPRPTGQRRVHSVADDHVELRPVPSGGALLDLQPERAAGRRAGPGVPGSAPSSSSARTSRPLVALLKWLTTLPRCRRPRAAPAPSPPAARGRAPGARTRRTSTSAGRRRRPRAGRVRDRRGRACSRQCADTPPSPGSDDVAGEPVRRDPVAGPDQPEQARGDRQPGRGAAPARAGRARSRPRAS